MNFYCILFLLSKCFFNVGPPKEDIFLTTFYSLYFNHQFTWYRFQFLKYLSVLQLPIITLFHKGVYNSIQDHISTINCFLNQSTIPEANTVEGVRFKFFRKILALAGIWTPHPPGLSIWNRWHSKVPMCFYYLSVCLYSIPLRNNIV